MKIPKSFFGIICVTLCFASTAYTQSGPNADDYSKMAEEFRKSHEPDSAIVYYEKASILYYDSGDAEKFVHACTQIGVILTRQDEYELAQTYLDKALVTGVDQLDSNNLTLATTYISLGVNYAAKEEYNTALIYHFKALDIRLRQLGENDAQVATSYGNIGNVYFRMKAYDQAIDAHLKAMKIRETLFGSQGVEVIQSYTNLGNAYKEKGDYMQALQYYQAALNNKTLQLGK